jgi:uncharacterized protein YbbC (DUF1343 family)
MAVVPGIQTLIDSGALDGRRVGLVSNPASLDARFRHAADLLAARDRITLVALFGPQHGYRSDRQDNMIETPHARDGRRGVPVFSLYSETREPTAEMLRELDVLIVDLQDVGTRVYTYVYTMANCLRAARRTGMPIVVCDRPNPVGGLGVEGPVLAPGCESFVGQFAIPLRHGMTIAELARLFNEHFGIGADLRVATMTGWRREDYFDETGLRWVMPSPNMPTLDTAIVYPGAVLFEGTMLSEGRGTTKPFELVGAPWINGERLAADVGALGLPGVHVRPVYFEPTFHKHARTTCGGCQVHVLDRRVFRPVLTAAAVVGAFRRADPARFAWKDPPYEYEYEKRPIDVLAGTPEFRAQIEAGVPPFEMAESWEADLDAFLKVRKKFLLY